MQSWLEQNWPVQLKQFGHQVGGHSLLLELTKDKVCKLLLPREHFFYSSIPQEISQFVPEYYGVVTVQFQRQDGEVQLMAYPSEHEPPPRPPSVGSDGPIVPYLKCTIGESLLPEGEDMGGISIETQGLAQGSYLNPWAVACQEKMSQALQTAGDKIINAKHRYIVLENLTQKYTSPCILDLKLGTRQHGDDIAEWKKQEHIMKCSSSTSASLGVRICGMQVFNVVEGQYNFRDKYYGRHLSEEQFYRALKEFLFNGKCYRRDIVPGLVAMLRALRDVIRESDSFRFFSSSLLIMYDGSMCNDGTDSQWTAAATQNHRGTASCQANTPNLEKLRKMVDLRMIDFAHSTHKGCLHDKVSYSGPDEGYLTGLNTLISSLEVMFPTIS